MCNSELDTDSSATLSRRKLLEFSGYASLAAALAACSRPQHQGTGAITAAASTTATVQTSVSPLVPSSAPQLVTISQPLLCRAAWGATPIRGEGRQQTPNRLTLHHSAVNFDDNRTITARLRQHQHYHQDDQGWIDIAYHVAVDREGNLFALRPFDLVGDTATDYDPTGHFLVLVEGNFDEQPVNEKQLNGAALAFAWAAQYWSIPTDSLMGHRDVPAQTTCPGLNLESHITSGDLKGRIDTLLTSGPIALPTVCGAEAASIVADIEAGR